MMTETMVDNEQLVVDYLKGGGSIAADVHDWLLEDPLLCMLPIQSVPEPWADRMTMAGPGWFCGLGGVPMQVGLTTSRVPFDVIGPHIFETDRPLALGLVRPAVRAGAADAISRRVGRLRRAAGAYTGELKIHMLEPRRLPMTVLDLGVELPNERVLTEVNSVNQMVAVHYMMQLRVAISIEGAR